MRFKIGLCSNKLMNLCSSTDFEELLSSELRCCTGRAVIAATTALGSVSRGCHVHW
jgi:hypothetical protein